MRTLLLILMLPVLSACTARSMYADVQREQAFDCHRLTGSDYRRCMEMAEKPYEEYQQEVEAYRSGRETRPPA